MGFVILIIAALGGIVAYAYLQANFPVQLNNMQGLTGAALHAAWVQARNLFDASVTRFCLAAGRLGMMIQGVTILGAIAAWAWAPAVIPGWVYLLIVAFNAVGIAIIGFSRIGRNVPLNPANPAAGFRVEYDAVGIANSLVFGLLVSGGGMLACSGLDPVQSSFLAFAGAVHLVLAGYVLYAIACAVAQLLRFAIKTGEFSADVLRGLPLAAYTGNWGRVQEAFERTNWANEDGIPPTVTEMAKKGRDSAMAFLALCILLPWWPLQVLVGITAFVLWDREMSPQVFFATRVALLVALFMRTIHPQGAAMQKAFLAALMKLVGYGFTKATGAIGAAPDAIEAYEIPALEWKTTVVALIGITALCFFLGWLAGKATGIGAKILGGAVGLVALPLVYLCVVAAYNLFGVAVPSAAPAAVRPTAPARTSSPSTATATPVPSIHTVGGSPAPVATTRAATRPAAPARQTPRPAAPVPVGNSDLADLNRLVPTD